MKKLITILALVLMFFASTAMAGTVCLEWDANTDPDLEGYKIFARQETEPSYDYNNPAWQGTETTCSFSLEDGITWYFVGRPYDTEGLESVDSAEISWYHEFPWINTPPGTIELRIINCDDLP